MGVKTRGAADAEATVLRLLALSFLMEMATVVWLNNSDARRVRALRSGMRVKVEGRVVCLVWVEA